MLLLAWALLTMLLIKKYFRESYLAPKLFNTKPLLEFALAMPTDCTDYDFTKIEPRWQEFWEQNDTFRAIDGSNQPKFYALDMFPYPSGAGLHIGHPEGYTASDILARYKRACGHNVLHPMGWDAFGLPAEQYAVKTGTHPKVTTQANVDNFRRQIKRFGFSIDWEREINTTDPEYYRWTVDFPTAIQARSCLC